MSRLATRDAALRPARSVPTERRYRDASPAKMLPWPAPADWTDRSECSRPGVDPEWFDVTPLPGSGKTAAELAAPALAICGRCPVRVECRELGDSLPRRTMGGQIFGGHLYATQGPRLEPYTPCAGTCGHPLRPARTSRADYPETREHAADGKCQPCHRKQAAA